MMTKSQQIMVILLAIMAVIGIFASLWVYNQLGEVQRYRDEQWINLLNEGQCYCTHMDIKQLTTNQTLDVMPYENNH